MTLALRDGGGGVSDGGGESSWGLTLRNMVPYLPVSLFQDMSLVFPSHCLPIPVTSWFTVTSQFLFAVTDQLLPCHTPAAFLPYSPYFTIISQLLLCRTPNTSLSYPGCVAAVHQNFTTIAKLLLYHTPIFTTRLSNFSARSPYFNIIAKPLLCHTPHTSLSYHSFVPCHNLIIHYYITAALMPYPPYLTIISQLLLCHTLNLFRAMLPYFTITSKLLLCHTLHT
jgi:hypothetical protein